MLRGLFLLLYFVTDRETLAELARCGWNSALFYLAVLSAAGVIRSLRSASKH